MQFPFLAVLYFVGLSSFLDFCTGQGIFGGGGGFRHGDLLRQVYMQGYSQGYSDGSVGQFRRGPLKIKSSSSSSEERQKKHKVRPVPIIAPIVPAAIAPAPIAPAPPPPIFNIQPVNPPSPQTGGGGHTTPVPIPPIPILPIGVPPIMTTSAPSNLFGAPPSQPTTTPGSFNPHLAIPEPPTTTTGAPVLFNSHLAVPEPPTTTTTAPNLSNFAVPIIPTTPGSILGAQAHNGNSDASFTGPMSFSRALRAGVDQNIANQLNSPTST